MTKMNSPRREVGILGLLLLFFGSRLAAQLGAVVITYAAPDVNQTRLFVNGENFSGGARVFLAGTELAGVVVDVLGRSLTADLPVGMTSGSYLLQVSNGVAPGETAAFVVVLGSGESRAQPAIHNYFFGASGNSSMTGKSNTGLGAFSLGSNTTGQNNMAAGVSALAANTEGYNNTAIGVQALFSNETGYSNTATGVFALYSNTTGSYNTASGENALGSNISGLMNTGVGWFALHSNTTGSDNAAFGKGTLLFNTTGQFNTALGVDALLANTTGHYNTAVGVDALYRNVSGIHNLAVGANALVFNFTGIENTASGMSAMYSNKTGSGNTGIGYGALFSNIGGHQITAVGYLAGGSVTGSNFSTFVGNQAGFNASQKVDPYNSMALGHGSYTTKNNQVVIGNASVVETLLNGNVGIGTTEPSSKLEVNGTADAKGYRVGGVVGVSCSGPPTAGFTVVNGIVTKC
jgi:hypothetical protein